MGNGKRGTRLQGDRATALQGYRVAGLQHSILARYRFLWMPRPRVTLSPCSRVPVSPCFPFNNRERKLERSVIHLIADLRSDPADLVAPVRSQPCAAHDLQVTLRHETSEIQIFPLVRPPREMTGNRRDRHLPALGDRLEGKPLPKEL